MKRSVAMCVLIVLAVFFMSNRSVDKTSGNGQTDGPYVIYKNDLGFSDTIYNKNRFIERDKDLTKLSQEKKFNESKSRKNPKKP